MDLIAAIDTVCLACWHTESACKDCPVRELADAIKENLEDAENQEESK